MRQGSLVLVALGALGSTACQKSPMEPELKPKAAAVAVDPLLAEAQLTLETDPNDIVAQSVVELMGDHMSTQETRPQVKFLIEPDVPVVTTPEAK